MSDTIHVLNTYPLDEAMVAQLQTASPRLVIEHRPDEDFNAIGSQTAEVLLADYTLNDLSLWPRLKWMQISAAGVDHLLANPPWERGIKVTHVSGIAAVSMAEYIITAILAYTRNLYEMHGFHIARTWAPNRLAIASTPLRGKTLVVVGYGSVGRETARLAQVFGLRILAVKNRPDVLEDDGYYVPGTGDPNSSIPERIYPISQLHEALAEADFVALSLPLTPKTHHIINAEALRAMKPTAFLVNVGRGANIDDDAFIQAMNEGWIAGASLDVFVTEPLPARHRIFQVPNTAVTSHMSGVCIDYWDRCVVVFAENLRRYAAGEPLLNHVTPEKGY